MTSNFVQRWRMRWKVSNARPRQKMDVKTLLKNFFFFCPQQSLVFHFFFRGENWTAHVWGDIFCIFGICLKWLSLHALKPLAGKKNRGSVRLDRSGLGARLKIKRKEGKMRKRFGSRSLFFSFIPFHVFSRALSLSVFQCIAFYVRLST